MQTKTFSVKDGTLRIENNNINLHFDGKDKTTLPLASTDRSKIDLPLYILPSTLIRNQTDEELAEKKYPYDGRSPIEALKKGFLSGRKSVGGEFHLTKEQVKSIYFAAMDGKTFEGTLQSLKQSIYPTTITVEHDGNNYYWETLKAEY